jgi:hypothetical protein
VANLEVWVRGLESDNAAMARALAAFTMPDARAGCPS